MFIKPTNVAAHLIPVDDFIRRNFDSNFHKYFLINSYHETDRFRTLLEYDDSLGAFRGAGLLQFSTYANYKALSSYLGVNRLLTCYDLLEPKIDLIAIKYFINERLMHYDGTFRNFVHLLNGAKGKLLDREVRVRLEKSHERKFKYIFRKLEETNA